MRFHASEAQRIDLKTDFVKGHYDVIITTYEMFSAEVHFFSQRFVWGLCVLDEGIKNLILE